jgi:uncharacterized membrane protein YphA (DoxX/SURF4 family)
VAGISDARERAGLPRSTLQLTATAVRWAAAVVLVIFGAGKFVNHASELASFRTYGLPIPDVFVYGVGVVELAGGALLATGRFVRLAAPVLAGDMVGAIIVSGIGRGENVSLTLAPALLVAMIFLFAIDVRASEDARLDRRTRSRLAGREPRGGH